MKNIIYVACLLFINVTHSQGVRNALPKLSQKDSLNLDKVFKGLIKAIESKQNDKIVAACLTEVECISCVGNDIPFNEEGYFVSAATFAGQAVSDFKKSKIYSALKLRGHSIYCRVIENFKPHSLPKNYPENLTLYEVWIQTLLPNELEKGHEGASVAFQFVKTNGGFKLYGITSIP